ncbi:MAG: hypothetical protein MRY63_02550 [Neomegalonema sp.]|nr:hypothetical protein [Neomegalonema sp.]
MKRQAPTVPDMLEHTRELTDIIADRDALIAEHKANARNLEMRLGTALAQLQFALRDLEHERQRVALLRDRVAVLEREQ